MSETLTDDETALLDQLATAVVRRGLTAPAILFLESIRPMNFLASQAMVFFAPMASLLFARKDYATLQTLLERRESIDRIITRIEELDKR